MRDYYESGKFGWSKLEYDGYAPFGNIMKTYIHPRAGEGDFPLRVLSVRGSCYHGLSGDFRFPPGMGLGMKYQMVANAVSPAARRWPGLFVK